MNDDRKKLFVDFGYRQANHTGESICGDAVMYRQLEDGRFIFVLSDGLGHGVKAGILSTMTASMALRFIAEDPDDIVHSAEIIMDALPVCQVRKISYATFTFVDVRQEGGRTRIIEMGNPGCILLRREAEHPLTPETLIAPRHPDRAMSACHFTARDGDRLIAMSDGVTQAGLGRPEYPTGWGREGCLARIREIVRNRPDISAHELSGRILLEAIAREENRTPADDMTLAVIHFRHPKRLMVFTGPPFDRNKDAECAAALRDYPGTKVISGGTTAEIVAREWGEKLETDFSTAGGSLPPVSRLPGADLVTEGIYTLPVTAKYLEQRSGGGRNDAAARLAELMREHDVIDFLVGTRINEAHQDPKLPIELELRRNLVRRIAAALRKEYLKEVTIKFV